MRSWEVLIACGDGAVCAKEKKNNAEQLSRITKRRVRVAGIFYGEQVT